MPAKPVLSEEDKKNIRQKLQALCEQLWVTQGYKKTSIKELCAHTGIAIGTFYSLFPTKEALFLDTAKTIQMRLAEQFKHTALQSADRAGLAKALKELFREYDSKPFLYDVNTPDFIAFSSKLSREELEAMQFENIVFFREICRITNLQPKIDETKACCILSALLSLAGTKQTLAAMYDYFEIFDFMTDKLLAEIFE